MRDTDEFDDLVAEASRAVGRDLHTPELVAERRRNLVVRCHSDDGSTVIIKQAHEPNQLIWNDWAAVAFLYELGRFGPRYLGGDREGRFFVMSEMSGLRTLDRICQTESREEATTALLEIARHTAQMHLATRDYEHRYRGLRDELSHESQTTSRRQAEEFASLLPRVKGVLGAYGIEPARGFDGEYQRITERFDDPESFMTFTVGDMAPSNTALSTDGPVLFDFEYAGYRHAFYDQLFWLIICPFPDDVADAAESVYRQGLVRGIEEAVDDAMYFREVAAIAAHHLYWAITWRLNEVYEQDSPWVGEMGTRLAYLHKTRSLVRLAERTDAWPALTITAQNLLEQLRQRFSEVDEATPTWPAFE